jgi:Mg2+ and Co2+ transporter CorA
MWRYVKAAFWAHFRAPLIGPLPLNALAVLGVGIFGCAEHALWLLGAGLETAYLYALATHPRFQGVVAAQEHARMKESAESSRHEVLAGLSPEAAARLERLEAKIGQVSALYATNQSDNLLLDSSLEALQKLGALYVRLLVAERNLQSASRQFDEAALARQNAALERELAAGGERLSASLRESKQATLELTQKRLSNARRRAESLAEIESDLTRIEAQVDLALEDAGLEGKPAVVTANLNLLNQILESNTALGGQDTSAGEIASHVSPTAMSSSQTPSGET